jgi:hypothetical protein
MGGTNFWNQSALRHNRRKTFFMSSHCRSNAPKGYPTGKYCTVWCSAICASGERRSHVRSRREHSQKRGVRRFRTETWSYAVPILVSTLHYTLCVCEALCMHVMHVSYRKITNCCMSMSSPNGKDGLRSEVVINMQVRGAILQTVGITIHPSS